MSHILTIADVASRLNVTRRTLERWIADGNGPIVTHLGPRRRGILESDFANWLASRRRVGVQSQSTAA
jgi:excisionase family DNA binding protein